jgi:predicted aspartyl protease
MATMKKRLYTILFFLIIIIIPIHSFSQSIGYYIKSNSRKVVIPFEIYNNLIIIPIKMNGLPLKFLLDTGVGNTILVKREFAEFIGLQFDRQIFMVGADRNKVMTAYVSNNVHISLGDIVNEREMLLTLQEDYLEFDRLFGADVQGIIGFEIFKQFVVRINYTTQTLTLYKKETFKAPRNKKFKSHFISIENTKPYIRACLTLENKDTFSGRFLLDTGASLDLLLDINSNDKITFPQKVIHDNMGHGLGGALEGKIGRMEKIDFSSFSFEGVIAFYQNDTLLNELIRYEKRNGIIGGGILSRFTVIFDYANNVVYFKKNAKYKKPFYFNMAGIILETDDNIAENYVIKEVLPNSPASEMDIRAGDKIIQLGGVRPPSLTRNYIKTIFNTKKNKKVRLKIVRGNEILKKTILLRELI